jgi:hypothetical protein
LYYAKKHGRAVSESAIEEEPAPLPSFADAAPASMEA